MDIFVARQPIFDKNLKVMAYELLYRNENENLASFSDGDLATSSVIANSLMVLGVENITDDKMAFINFTENLIKQEIPTVFDNQYLVIEILEDIVPDEEFIDCIKKMKLLGYKVALDDFVLDYDYIELIKLADIIKVDFLLTDIAERLAIVKRYKSYGIDFLAEKIETMDEFKEAVNAGYKYFQGYFFSRPVVMQKKDVKSFSGNYIRLVTELNKPEPEYGKIGEIIETDVSLTYKFLKLVNSPAFSGRRRIKNIDQALVRLGFKEIRKIVSILMLRNLGADKPPEIIRSSLLRAKFAEAIARQLNRKGRASEYFLVGLFSMIDTLVERTLEDILLEMPFEEDMKGALLGAKNDFRIVLDVVIAYEQADWDSMFSLCTQMSLDKLIIPNLYFDSLTWTKQTYGEV